MLGGGTVVGPLLMGLEPPGADRQHRRHGLRPRQPRGARRRTTRSADRRAAASASRRRYDRASDREPAAASWCWRCRRRLPALVVLAGLAWPGVLAPEHGADRRRCHPAGDRARDRPLRRGRERRSATRSTISPPMLPEPAPARRRALGLGRAADESRLAVLRLARAWREQAHGARGAPRRGRGGHRRGPRPADPARRAAADRPRQRRRRRFRRRRLAAARPRRGAAQPGGAGGGRCGACAARRRGSSSSPSRSRSSVSCAPALPASTGRRSEGAVAVLTPARRHRIEARRADARRFHRQCEPRAAHPARHPDRLYRDPARTGARRRRSRASGFSRS